MDFFQLLRQYVKKLGRLHTEGEKGTITILLSDFQICLDGPNSFMFYFLSAYIYYISK